MGTLLERAIGWLGGAAEPASPEPSRNRRSADVVVVDDNPGIQKLAKDLVTKAGFACEAAASLEQVVALGPCDGVKLLFLDLALDGSDAFDVLRHLGEIGYTGPIVPISGQEAALLDYVGSFGRQLNLKMMPPLQKPFRLEALRIVLSEHLQSGSRQVPIDFDAVLERNQLEVWYQPRVDLRTFHIVGFEALVRVRHPSEGLLLPVAFMAQLTDRDMANLTQHVLQRTITAWESLARAGSVLKPSMNVRARELLDPRLINVLKERRPTDARWSGLVMELTDPKLIDEVEAAREAVVRLQLQKVQLALDGFGTVASGLVRCPELKLSEIGIDRQFVNGCARDPDRLAICKAAVKFGERSRIRVVAEGVEKEEDMRAVRAQGANWAQGNFFSAAVPFESLAALVRKREPLLGAGSLAGTAA